MERMWKIGLAMVVLGIMVLGYGGWCKKSHHHDDIITGSSWSSNISGSVFNQTSENTMVPLGGATVTAEWAASPGHTRQTKTNSDGSYRFEDIDRDVPVNITITDEDMTSSIETVTTSEESVKASAFLKGKGKKKGIIKKNENSTLNTYDDTSMPRCEITVPAYAVESNIPDVILTSYHEMETLPAPLPDGYLALAGADFYTSSSVTFASGKEADCYIILPSSVKAEELSTADIRLMEFVNDNWVINTGYGKAFTSDEWAGYIGPDDSTPAQLKGVRPWCWAISGTSISQITGTVKDTSGNPIPGVFVFGHGAKTHTRSNGTYTLKNIRVIKDDTLVPVHAIAQGYEPGHQFINISPGETISGVDFILQPRSTLAEVYGQVTNADNSNPIPGAIVTIQTAQTIRGMKYSDEDTPASLTDDIFYVNPAGMTITQYKWMLTPPSGSVFESTIENGSSVVLHHLATEASCSTTGAYKVELEATYANGKKPIVSGGFLLKQTGLVLYIAEVKLSVSLQDQLILKTTTDNQGNYRFINLPTGETLYASVRADGFTASDTVEISALSPGEWRLQNFSLVPVSADYDPPFRPTYLTGTALSPFSIKLNWFAAMDNVGIDHYQVYRDGNPIGKTTNLSYVDSGLEDDTPYDYQVGAFDQAGNSTLGGSINVSTPIYVTDATNPTSPTNLAASVISPYQINLSWNASTDNVGVLGYQVYRDGAPLTPTNTTGYADTDLSPSTTYEYKVAAYDAAGNPSDYSEVVNPTTLAADDTAPPTDPTGLDALALSSHEIAISWTASTDNEGVTGYKVYREGTFIISVAGTAYTDTGLAPLTLYTYKVAAYDAAGNTSAQSAPAEATTTEGADWAQVAAGRYYTIARKSDGTIWAWGRNGNGELGLGDTTNRYTPVQVGTDTDWSAVADGYRHTIALKTDGTLWAWGRNYLGGLGLGDTTDRYTPTQVGTDTNWAEGATGYWYTLARKTDGTLWAWGDNVDGALGLGDTTNRSTPVQVGTDTDWAEVACGAQHTIARKTDNTLWAWGRNFEGQLGLGYTSGQENSPVRVGIDTDWAAVAGGYYHTIARKTDGTLWAWGRNYYGQLGLGYTSDYETTPTKIGTDTDWSAVAAGYRHTIVLKTNDTLWAWGWNYLGQLGLGDTTDRYTPTQVGDTDWAQVAGGWHTIALKTDATLWAWGANGNGELGLGDVTNRYTPTPVE